jgi:hypothetical protein
VLVVAIVVDAHQSSQYASRDFFESICGRISEMLGENIVWSERVFCFLEKNGMAVGK